MRCTKKLMVALVTLCLSAGLCATSAFALDAAEAPEAVTANPVGQIESSSTSGSAIAFTQSQGKATGLYKVGGKWKYYENGTFANKTGLVKNPRNDKWYFVRNGVLSKATGLVRCIQGSAKGSWFYVRNGEKTSYTGMVKCIQGSAKGWKFYVYKGKKSSFTGLVRKSPNSKVFVYVKDGAFKRYTGAVYQNGKYHYVKKGYKNKKYRGRIKIYGSTYKVRHGICIYDRYRNLAYPDHYSSYSAPCTVGKSGVVLRYGPSKKYAKVKRVSKGTLLYERGYSSSFKWLYVRDSNYNYGWIKTSQVHFVNGVAKPVVYLYPKAQTDVSVSVNLSTGKMMNSIPDYGNGWNVTAQPDGTIVNRADGKKYPYLFWDADSQLEYDWSKGYVIKGSDTESFLNRILTEMGLSPRETRDFTEFWVPYMKDNAYNLITFQTERYTDAVELGINPKPDSLLRVFMAYKPLDKPVSIEASVIEKFERKGFTVVEWGGSEAL